MNRLIFLILGCLALLSAPFSTARAGHDSPRDLAQDLEKQAKELREGYKDFLKDIRHWEPRRREAQLLEIMDDLAHAADDLGDDLKDGWGRKSSLGYQRVSGLYQVLERYIVLARDRKVQQRFHDVTGAMIRLARRGPQRDYDRRGSYRDSGRSWSIIAS